MAKIGIYIPDAKMPEVQQWAKVLNFSVIFRDAFDEVVKRTCSSEASRQYGVSQYTVGPWGCNEA